jgi:hypothetical protein
VLAVEGQVGPDPQFDPLALTVSDYAVADRGGATDWAMLTLAASTVALAFALPRVSRLARSLLGVFAAGMLVAAVAPTDEGLALSTTGHVHRYASVAAFVVLPAAGFLLARRSASRLGWAAPTLRRLATATVVFMAAMLASQALAGRALIGLAERLLLAAGVAMLAVLAVRAHQLALARRAGAQRQPGCDVDEHDRQPAAGERHGNHEEDARADGVLESHRPVGFELDGAA